MDKTGKTILVTGATGKQGGAAACHLLGAGWDVRAFTRDPGKPAAKALADAGATIVNGDFDDRASVERAVAGAYGVFSVQNTWEAGEEAEVRQGKMLADLAKAAGVEHLVYNSVGSADRKTGIPHFESKWEIEEHIRAIGIPVTIFRPVFFMDNLLAPDTRKAILGGILPIGMHPMTRLQVIAVDDIGAFVAKAFDDLAGWLGREVEIAGDALTGPEAAEKLSTALGKTVTFQEVPIEQIRAFSEDYAIMLEWFNAHGYGADIPALRAVHPSLMDFDTWARKTDWTDA